MLDPRIEEVRKQYGLAASDFWELPQKKGTWIAKHAALEAAAVKARIAFAPPMVLEANGEAKSAALCVTGTMGERTEWSIGEASPANNRNAYPYAMAEKRGKDRVILKLIGLHGLAYSEDEADDFKATAPPPSREDSRPLDDPSRQGLNTAAQKPQDGDVEDGTKNWCAQQKAVLDAAKSLPDLTGWLDHLGAGPDGGAVNWIKLGSGSPLDRLKRKAPEAYEDLKRHYLARLGAL